jgi:hypothetical protein
MKQWIQLYKENPRKQRNDNIGHTFYKKNLGKEEGNMIRSLILSTPSR